MFDGVGLSVSDKPSGDKIDDSSLEHFIDFTTSSHIIKDLPFAQKTLKLESGEVLKILKVIHKLDVRNKV